MPSSNKSRFDFAKPSAKVTRAIVIRGKSRFAIIRPDVGSPAIIRQAAFESGGGASQLRIGGIPQNANAAHEFEVQAFESHAVGALESEPRGCDAAARAA